MGDGGAPPLARALSVAGLLAGVFAAATGDRTELAKPAPSAPASRAPFADLDSLPRWQFSARLDFSLDQAALTWARRLAPGDKATAGHDALRRDAVQRSIVERVVKAARTTGSDPALLMSIADKESSFASSAKASTSSASDCSSSSRRLG